jgi:RNA polymerase sigma factor (sigma-70 family)
MLQVTSENRTPPPKSARLRYFRLMYSSGVGRSLNVQEDPDDGLVAALDTGNYRLAIEILLIQHGDYIYGYCRRLLGNGIEAEAQDVAQTVFAQAYQDLRKLSDPRVARAWLRVIARHRCVDCLRARRREPQIMDDSDLCLLIDRQLAIGHSYHDPRIGQALDECLDCLDVRSREVLVLRFHDELSFEEISKLTSDTPGALRVRSVRALLVLRRCLERKGVYA